MSLSIFSFFLVGESIHFELNLDMSAKNDHPGPTSTWPINYQLFKSFPDPSIELQPNHLTSGWGCHFHRLANKLTNSQIWFSSYITVGQPVKPTQLPHAKKQDLEIHWVGLTDLKRQMGRVQVEGDRPNLTLGTHCHPYRHHNTYINVCFRV